jgi:signal transduction histidine kinase/ActR/RegA family two-component response regulator
MTRFADLPIRRKLLLVAWIISASALTLMLTTFVIWSFVVGRRNVQSGLGLQAAILSGNLSAAVSFGDATSTNETLGALSGAPTIDLACAYTPSGLLGQFNSGRGGLVCPAAVPPDIDTVDMRGATIVRAVTLKNERVGTLYIKGNLTRMLEQMRLQLIGGLLGFGVALFAAALIATRLHRSIADPILSLSATSAEIARGGDYSLRAGKSGNDEIGALVDVFNDMLSGIERRDEELRDANRMKDEFLAVLSHELRTPLNAIVGWLQILRMQPQDPAVVERALASLDRNARAQARLIEDLLDVSRIITGKLQLRMDVVDLCTVVEGSAEVLRPAAEAKKVALTVTIDANPPCLVSGDADRLQQAVSNILSNAVKFTGAGGAINLRLAATGSDYVVTVRDTGVGIEPEFLPRVFDRFRQADGSVTRHHGGLGLGLAIVRDLVALHGGRVEAASDGAGRGATFSIRIPQLLQAPAPAARPASPSEVRRLDGLHVLVADDDADARSVAAQALQAAGAAVEMVAGGQEALALLERRQFDVFVCDIAMPDIDGYSLLQSIRQRERPKGQFMPAVAVTAHAGATEAARAHSAGYQGFVVKPYDFAVLSNAVASAVRPE